MTILYPTLRENENLSSCPQLGRRQVIPVGNAHEGRDSIRRRRLLPLVCSPFMALEKTASGTEDGLRGCSRTDHNLIDRLGKVFPPITTQTALSPDQQLVAKSNSPLRIGILGAGKVATYAMIWPAKSDPNKYHAYTHACANTHMYRNPDVEILAVGARSFKRALKYAKLWGIPRSYGSYQELIDDPLIEAVYIALPNGRHAEWAIKAIKAGKHVLCEKPIASNAFEAESIAQSLEKMSSSLHSATPPLVCWEAMHWRHHPVASRLKGICNRLTTTRTTTASSPPGGVKALKARFLVPPPSYTFASKTEEIRFQYALAGGAMMDLGCYCVDIVRYLSGDSRPEVISASATTQRGLDPQIDTSMQAELRVPGIDKVSIECSFFGPWGSSYWGSSSTVDINIIAEDGTSIRCENFLTPHFNHRITYESGVADNLSPAAKETKKRNVIAQESQYGDGFSTYHYQLANFVKATRGMSVTLDDPSAKCPSSSSSPFSSSSSSSLSSSSSSSILLPTATQAVEGMRVIDDIYTASGLDLRYPSSKLTAS
eukprot:jgi/Bigna1/145538/aug1.100_g20246